MIDMASEPLGGRYVRMRTWPSGPPGSRYVRMGNLTYIRIIRGPLQTCCKTGLADGYVRYWHRCGSLRSFEVYLSSHHQSPTTMASNSRPSTPTLSQDMRSLSVHDTPYSKGSGSHSS